MEVRAVGKLMKNIFGLIAQGLESDVVNSEPVLATGFSCTIVKWLKYPVQRRWCSELSSRFRQTGFESSLFLLLAMQPG